MAASESESARGGGRGSSLPGLLVTLDEAFFKRPLLLFSRFLWDDGRECRTFNGKHETGSGEKVPEEGGRGGGGDDISFGVRYAHNLFRFLGVHVALFV